MKKMCSMALMVGLVAVQANAEPVDSGAILNQLNQSAKSGHSLDLRSSIAPKVFDGFKGYIGLDDQEVGIVKEISHKFIGQKVVISGLIGYIAEELQKHGFSVVLKLDDQGILNALHPTLGAIIIDNQSRLNDETIQRVVGYNVKTLAPLNRPLLERNASILNEVPGIRNEYVMKPGARLHETNLYVAVRDAKPFDAYLSLDNGGLSSMGIYQTSAGINTNNLLGFTEKISINALKSQHGSYGQIAIDFLATPAGLRVGGSASSFWYDYSVAGSQSSLPYEGQSNNYELNANIPLIRSEYEKLGMYGNYNHKTSRGDVNNAENSYWLIDSFTMGAQGSKGLVGQANISYTISLTAGHASQSNLESAANDAYLGQQGNYIKLNVQSAYTIATSEFLHDSSVTINFYGQVANSNLPGSEKLYVGGQSMMKAYSPQIVGGDTLAYLELRLEQWESQQLKLGVFGEYAYVDAFMKGIGGSDIFKANYAGINRLADVGVLSTYLINATTDITVSVARQVGRSPELLSGLDVSSTNHQNGPWAGYFRATYRY